MGIESGEYIQSKLQEIIFSNKKKNDEKLNINSITVLINNFATVISGENLSFFRRRE